MDSYTVALFGHRDMPDLWRAEKRLYAFLRELMQRHPYVEIYLGRNGEFDRMAASVIRRLQRETGEERVTMMLVLPYAVRRMEDYERYYGNILIPECVEGVHPKRAIGRRNRWMVERCELALCYVTHGGGASAAMTYALRLGKQVENLAEGQEEEE